MDSNSAAACMESLGNPTRLDIFRLLVRAGQSGTPVGTIQNKLNIPASTLSHHVSHLVKNGLVSQIREGRSLKCSVNFAQMHQLLDFLTEECCADESTQECAAPKACC
ncbi:MAG: helix-turn-helix domain-containing protein [Pseudomonadota bacterium]